MMPPTATYEDIKAYQAKVEKNKITPHSLPACPRCKVESSFFKIHAYRERRFLIVVEMFVQTVLCTLVRFCCPGCRKTMTLYPDFAIPHKHYTRQTIMGYAGAYLEPEATYQMAAMHDHGVPGYPHGDATLAPSSIHRWITSLAGYVNTCRTALSLLVQESPACPICRDLAQWRPPRRKFRSEHRKQELIRCRRLSVTESFFQHTFNRSVFTKLATAHAFG